MALGAAILYDPENFVDKMDDGTQRLLISPPVKQLDFWISSANSRENEVDSLEDFLRLLEKE